MMVKKMSKNLICVNNGLLLFKLFLNNNNKLEEKNYKEFMSIMKIDSYGNRKNVLKRVI